MSEPRTKSASLSCLLGLWLGASIVVFGVAIYNFAGFSELFERNPKLAEQAGFDPANENARKTSLLWVHSSELNRVYFELWGKAQLGLASLILIVALVTRAGKFPLMLIALALGIVIYGHFFLNPEIVSIGRSLDFVSRSPEPPPGLERFGQLHGQSVILELVRLLCVLGASVFALVGRAPGNSTWSPGRSQL